MSDKKTQRIEAAIMTAFWCIIQFVFYYIGFFQPGEVVYNVLHPFGFWDLLGLIMFTGGTAFLFALYYWVIGELDNLGEVTYAHKIVGLLAAALGLLFIYNF